jgi:hypothetical protein
VWDLSGCPEHASLRRFAYRKADVIICCFSLADGQTCTPLSEIKKVVEEAKEAKDVKDQQKKSSLKFWKGPKS